MTARTIQSMSCNEDPSNRGDPTDGLTVEMRIDNVDVDSDDSLEFGLSNPQLDGKYRVQKRLGQGGCGTVWLAEQQPPVSRAVAIKFLREHADEEFAKSRFTREHQALAMMNHPFIASIYDWGIAEDDVPYLVMELVDGGPITNYCDTHKFGIQERLKLFVKLCEAVEHAHQRGIIHRDIKPTNVLITTDGHTAVPKLIDFGLAKPVPGSRKDTDSHRTMLGFTVGTPAYMSPEQIGGTSGVDVRTDVYALGVLLYQLVVGTVPFVTNQDADAGVARLLFLILNTEPEAPQSRLRNSSMREEIAANRGDDWKHIERMVRGDLATIMLKAIAKRPEHRYSSVEAFRRDIVCYLHHWPIEARPSSRFYRLHKFLHRHRFLAVVTAGAAVALLVACIGLAQSLLWAWRAEIDAQVSLISQRQANARTTRALQALTESLEYATQVDPERGYPLLEQVATLHDLATEATDGHAALTHAKIQTTGTTNRMENVEKALQVLAHLQEEQPELKFEMIQRNLQAHLQKQTEAMRQFSQDRSR